MPDELAAKGYVRFPLMFGGILRKAIGSPCRGNFIALSMGHLVVILVYVVGTFAGLSLQCDCLSALWGLNVDMAKYSQGMLTQPNIISNPRC